MSKHPNPQARSLKGCGQEAANPVSVTLVHALMEHFNYSGIIPYKPR